MALGVYVFVLAGIPAAVLGTVLAARQRRRSGRWAGMWGSVVFGGLVFQMCGVTSAAFLLLLLLAAATEDVVVFVGDFVSDAVVFAGVLVLVFGCSLWGVRSWRALLRAGQEEPLTIASR
jgi:hypothetical protein